MYCQQLFDFPGTRVDKSKSTQQDLQKKEQYSNKIILSAEICILDKQVNELSDLGTR
jgi:hypothetical protein